MALSYSPTDPVAGDTVSLSITGATGQTAATRFSLTSVPSASALNTGALVDAGGSPVQEFTPDAPGAYGIEAYDYRRVNGLAQYGGDPAGVPYERLVATQTGTVYVCDVLDLPIRGAGHAVTLRLAVSNDTIRTASLVNPTTEIARCATLDTTVLAAVAALEDVAVASIGASVVSDVEAFSGKFDAHLDSPTAHFTEDVANQLPDAELASVAAAIWRVNELQDRYVRHISTDGGWHGVVDLENLPIAERTTSLAGAFVVLADMRRVYPRHIAIVADLHQATDSAANISADSLLTDAVQAVLDYFDDETPTAPAGTNPGAVSLAGMFGFRLAAD